MKKTPAYMASAGLQSLHSNVIVIEAILESFVRKELILVNQTHVNMVFVYTDTHPGLTVDAS